MISNVIRRNIRNLDKYKILIINEGNKLTYNNTFLYLSLSSSYALNLNKIIYFSSTSFLTYKSIFPCSYLNKKPNK